MELLKETLSKISGSNKEIKEEVKLIWDNLAKPLGSLGTLEEIGIKIAGISGKTSNKINKKAIVVMAGDNGIFEENIAASPQTFTKILVENTAGGLTGVCTLSKFTNTDVFVVDMGVNADISHPDVINRKIGYGTKNFTKEKAMTYEEAIKAIEIGIEIADDLYGKGYDILGVGELGIGNTTTSSAILSVISGLDVDTTCGLGAGLTDDQYKNKKRVIEKGIELHNPDPKDPIDILSKVGGFDIAGMCGVYLSAAKNKKPVVIDGFISSAAALCAIRLKSEVKDYIIPSHLSKEPGAMYMFKELDMEPMLNLDMRLGEGSGCPLAFQIIESALYTQENMGTFADLEIDSSILIDIREED